MDGEIIEIESPGLEFFEEPGFLYFQKRLCEWSIAIVDDVKSRKASVGTAVLINIANRRFAASASHCIRANPFLANGGWVTIPGTPTKTRNVVKLDEDVIDIGLLEIDGLPNRTPCTLDNICTDAPIIPANPSKPERPFYYICGYPHDSGERAPDGSLKEIGASSLGTYPLAVSERRYEFCYPIGFIHRDGETLVESTTPQTPKGLSGGGVWQIQEPNPGELYSPNIARLYGIQYAWSDDHRRKAYVVPIRHWLKLVYDNYSDLQNLLAERFPFLNA